MGILIIVLTLWVIWKAWGIVFDGKRVTVNPKPYTVEKIREWRSLAEAKMTDPKLSEEQKRDALRDIEFFSKVLTEMGVEV
jgi:lipopolysaccharide/colanic/teichoic acid biosynthesis glycosyltransferase